MPGLIQGLLEYHREEYERRAMSVHDRDVAPVDLVRRLLQWHREVYEACKKNNIAHVQIE